MQILPFLTISSANDYTINTPSNNQYANITLENSSPYDLSISIPSGGTDYLPAFSSKNYPNLWNGSLSLSAKLNGSYTATSGELVATVYTSGDAQAGISSTFHSGIAPIDITGQTVSIATSPSEPININGAVITQQGSLTNTFQDAPTNLYTTGNTYVAVNSTNGINLVGSGTGNTVNVGDWGFTNIGGQMGGDDLFIEAVFMDPSDTFEVGRFPIVIQGNTGGSSSFYPFSTQIPNLSSNLWLSAVSASTSNLFCTVYNTNRKQKNTIEFSTNTAPVHANSTGNNVNALFAFNGQMPTGDTKYSLNSQYSGKALLWGNPQANTNVQIVTFSKTSDIPSAYSVQFVLFSLDAGNTINSPIEILLPNLNMIYGIRLNNTNSMTQPLNFNLIPI